MIGHVCVTRSKIKSNDMDRAMKCGDERKNKTNNKYLQQVIDINKENERLRKEKMKMEREAQKAEIRDTVEKMFLSSGRTIEEAHAYIEENNMYSITNIRLVCTLAILKRVELDRFMFFNVPDFITQKHSLYDLDRAVKSIDGDVSNIKVLYDALENTESKEATSVFNYRITKMYQEYIDELNTRSENLTLR